MTERILNIGHRINKLGGVASSDMGIPTQYQVRYVLKGNDGMSFVLALLDDSGLDHEVEIVGSRGLYYDGYVVEPRSRKEAWLLGILSNALVRPSWTDVDSCAWAGEPLVQSDAGVQELLSEFIARIQSWSRESGGEKTGHH